MCTHAANVHGLRTVTVGSLLLENSYFIEHWREDGSQSDPPDGATAPPDEVHPYLMQQMEITLREVTIGSTTCDTPISAPLPCMVARTVVCTQEEFPGRPEIRVRLDIPQAVTLSLDRSQYVLLRRVVDNNLTAPPETLANEQIGCLFSVEYMPAMPPDGVPAPACALCSVAFSAMFHPVRVHPPLAVVAVPPHIAYPDSTAATCVADGFVCPASSTKCTTAPPAAHAVCARRARTCLQRVCSRTSSSSTSLAVSLAGTPQNQISAGMPLNRWLAMPARSCWPEQPRRPTG